MSDTTPAENHDGPATALAEPPQPPTTPPGAVASGTPEPGKRRAGLIVAVVLSVLAIAMLAAVAWIVMNSRGEGGGSASTIAAYESAMRKAGVDAPYPGKPVDLTSITPSGSHAFSATFTPAEIAALLNTFPYQSDVAGIRTSLRNVSLKIPAAGTANLAAAVTANGGTYAGSVTLPLSFSSGRVDTTGVTDLKVEGISGNDAQKAQVSSALLGYFNSYLRAAPGLAIESASIGTEGVDVKGTAPDSLKFP